MAITFTEYFMKYYGGKLRYLPFILGKMPRCSTFFDIFVGGGSVFSSFSRSQSYWINDVNPYLINFYERLRDDYDNLLKQSFDCYEKLEKYRYRYRDDILKELRDNFEKNTENAGKWFALQIVSKYSLRYANGKITKTGFHYDTEDKEKLRGFTFPAKNTAEKLKKAKITNTSYEEVIAFAREGDIVYADPPYMPSNEHHNESLATLYYNRFIDFDKFAILMKELHKRGVFVAVSGNEKMMEYFNKDFDIYEQQTVYSSRHDRSKITNECLAINFKPYGQQEFDFL